MKTNQRLESTNFSLWRICAWAGPLFIVSFLIFWGIIANYVPAPRQYWTAARIFQFYSENNLRIRIGMVGATFFAPVYFVWSTVVSRIMQRIEGPDGVLSNVELMGGVCTVVITQAFAVMWLAASFRIESRTPHEVQLLHDIGWFFFNSTFMVTALQLTAFGVVILMDARARPLLPRWLGWLSFAAVSTFLSVLLMPFVMDGPFAWHGLLTYWVALSGFFIWAVAACIFIFGAISRLEIESLDSASSAVVAQPVTRHLAASKI
jgi:hypothetical protein